MLVDQTFTQDVSSLSRSYLGSVCVHEVGALASLVGPKTSLDVIQLPGLFWSLPGQWGSSHIRPGAQGFVPSCQTGEGSWKKYSHILFAE